MLTITQEETINANVAIPAITPDGNFPNFLLTGYQIILI